jgi:PAS domain S-box-containing protein
MYLIETPIQVDEYPKYFRAVTGGQVIVADDVYTNDLTNEFTDSYFIPHGIHSMLDIPVKYCGRNIGILCHESTSKRNWSEADLKIATALASIITSVMEVDLSNQFDKDIQESQRFLNRLISNLPGYVYKVRRENDQWTFQYLSEGIYDLTGYKPSELIESQHLYYGLMVNEDDKSMAKIAVTNALGTGKPYEITYRIRAKDGNIKWVWERGRGVFDERNSLVATEGFVTEITQQKLAEEELIKKNKELAIINSISQSLSKLTESEKLIPDICIMLSKLFNIDNLYIALYDEDKNLISFPYYAIEGRVLNPSAREFGNGLTEFVIKTRKALIINSARHETLEMLGIEPHGRDALSILASPMMVGEDVIGVITLQDYKNENVFTQSQLDTLNSIASQAAIAIENSRLYSSLKKSLFEKEILLQEVHHRVKNNLQIMSSLIKLQSHYVEDPLMLQILKETESRIQSMSIVHSKLYSTQEYEKVNFGEYVKSLTDNFWNTYGIKLKNLKFEIDIGAMTVNIDTAIPCGLIINELVSNSIKYAFPDGRNGTIRIELKKASGKSFYILTVSDDGVGIVRNIDVNKSDTLGIQLVNLLAKQMNGKFEIESRHGYGTVSTVTLEEAVYKSRK